MCIRCINEYLTAEPALLNCFVDVEDKKTIPATFQYINNLTDYLTLSNKDFLNEFSQSFCNINNLDKIGKKFQQIFELLDFNKKFAHLQSDSENHMGLFII